MQAHTSLDMVLAGRMGSASIGCCARPVGFWGFWVGKENFGPLGVQLEALAVGGGGVGASGFGEFEDFQSELILFAASLSPTEMHEGGGGGLGLCHPWGD